MECIHNMAFGRRLGGIIALILGALQLILAILYVLAYPGATDMVQLIVNIALAIGIIVGAVLSLGNNRGGGAICVVMAFLMIAFMIMATIDPSSFGMLAPFSSITAFTGWSVTIPYVTLESLILLFAGIITAVSPE